MKTLTAILISIATNATATAYFFPAEANLLGGYISGGEPQPVAQKRTLSSGSRSNCQSNLNKGDVALAVPDEEVVHLTTKSNPSVYLVSNQSASLPFKFTLVDPESSEIVAQKNLHLEGKGIQEITLDSSVSLSEGKTYLWYVAFSCQNEAEESYDILGAGIKKISISEEVTSALKGEKNPTEKAKVFARNGIWYEALESAMQNPNDTNYDYVRQLLKSAGIEEYSAVNTAQK